MKSQTNTGYVAFLSLVAAIGGILFGYDTAVISGTISGVAAQFSLDAMQQGWFVGCALVGSIGGVAVAGVLSDRFGRKLTMLLSAVLFTVSAVGCAVSADFTQLVVYRIVGGVGIGVVSIVSPMYISEVAVARWRGTLVSLYQLAITVGFLAAYLVNFQILKSAETAVYASPWMQKIWVTELWRGMFGAETLPALLFFTVIFFIPESPAGSCCAAATCVRMPFCSVSTVRRKPPTRRSLPYTARLPPRRSPNGACCSSRVSARRSS